MYCGCLCSLDASNRTLEKSPHVIDFVRCARSEIAIAVASSRIAVTFLERCRTAHLALKSASENERSGSVALYEETSPGDKHASCVAKQFHGQQIARPFCFNLKICFFYVQVHFFYLNEKLNLIWQIAQHLTYHELQQEFALTDYLRMNNPGARSKLDRIISMTVKIVIDVILLVDL